jgi:gas vesicle protein
LRWGCAGESASLLFRPKESTQQRLKQHHQPLKKKKNQSLSSTSICLD